MQLASHKKGCGKVVFSSLSKTGGGGGGDTTSGAEIKEEEPFSVCLSEEEGKFNKLETIEFSLKGECNI